MLVSLSYRPHQSLIDKLDPRARWIFSLLMLFTITLFWDFRFLAFFFLIAMGQFLLTKLSWAETRRAWLAIFAILMMMIIVNTLITSSGTIRGVITGGTPLWQVNLPLPVFNWHIHFTLTLERVWFALAQFLRMFSIAALFLVIPFTMDPRIYGITFRGIGMPDKLAYTMDLSFRFIPTLARDFSVTMDAQRARGYEIERAEGGLIARVRKIAPLLVPVTMNAILAGEDIANAMDLRCFGLQQRTWVQKLSYKWYDFALIIFSLLLFVGGLIIRYGFNIGNFWFPGM